MLSSVTAQHLTLLDWLVNLIIAKIIKLIENVSEASKVTQ